MFVFAIPSLTRVNKQCRNFELQREVERLQGILQSPPMQVEGFLEVRSSLDPVGMTATSAAHAKGQPVESVPLSSLPAPCEGVITQDDEFERPRSVARSLHGIELPPETIDTLFAL